MEKREKKFLQYYGLEVDISDHATRDILKLLEDYVLGTEGGLRYRQMNLKERLSAIGEIWFMSLRKAGRILGTVGFVRRTARNGEQQVNTYYIRYFSIRLPQVRKNRKRKGDKPPARPRGSVLKEQVERFMGNVEKYLKGTEGVPSVLYAYIEEENLPSLQMSSRMGYVTVRRMTHTFFSRFYPRRHSGVAPVKEEEKMTVLEKICSFYHEYTLFQEEPLFLGDGYLVYKNEQGDIAAGVQTLPVNWEIVEMPGVAGWFFRKVIPRLPWLKKFFDGRRFRFVAFEGLFYEEGCEQAVPILFETALARHGLSLGMIWYDTESPLAAMMRRLPNKGFFGRMIRPVPAQVRMRFLNMPQDKVRMYYEKPVYIPAFDLT